MKKNKLERFLIIRMSDLKSIASVSGINWMFEKNRFGFVTIGGWGLAVIFFFAFLFSETNNSLKLHNLHLKHKSTVCENAMVTDSLKSVIEEKTRRDSFMHVCYEVLTTTATSVNHDRIWEFIQKCDPWYPDIIMMQAVQESGCGKSDVGKRCNNLFGMTKPQSRKWRCDKNRLNKEQFAEYEDWRYSVIDRILWERWTFRNRKVKPTIEEYMSAIDNVYNTETAGYADHIYKNAEKYRKLL